MSRCLITAHSFCCSPGSTLWGGRTRRCRRWHASRRRQQRSGSRSSRSSLSRWVAGAPLPSAGAARPALLHAVASAPMALLAGLPLLLVVVVWAFAAWQLPLLGCRTAGFFRSDPLLPHPACRKTATPTGMPTGTPSLWGMRLPPSAMQPPRRQIRSRTHRLPLGGPCAAARSSPTPAECQAGLTPLHPGQPHSGCTGSKTVDSANHIHVRFAFANCHTAAFADSLGMLSPQAAALFPRFVRRCSLHYLVPCLSPLFLQHF